MRFNNIIISISIESLSVYISPIRHRLTLRNSLKYILYQLTDPIERTIEVKNARIWAVTHSYAHHINTADAHMHLEGKGVYYATLYNTILYSPLHSSEHRGILPNVSGGKLATLSMCIICSTIKYYVFSYKNKYLIPTIFWQYGL